MKGDMSKLLKVLITNDDGVYALGMDMICRSLEGVANVTVVAPAEEKSASGHSVTLRVPLRVNHLKSKYGMERYSLNGTSADCVKFALSEIYSEPPDLLISGINLVENVGVDILYSGTVAGAVEGAIYGIPSVAISVQKSEKYHFDVLSRFVRTLYNVFGDFLKKQQEPDRMLLNVNLPSVPIEEIIDIASAVQGQSPYTNGFDKREDQYGNIYYWLKGGKNINRLEGTDEMCLSRKNISIMPLTYDFTDYDSLNVKNSRKKIFPLQRFIEAIKKDFFGENPNSDGR